eukprot:jgi/Galph1/2169/GphlegSOOS_G830.1
MRFGRVGQLFKVFEVKNEEKPRQEVELKQELPNLSQSYFQEKQTGATDANQQLQSRVHPTEYSQEGVSVRVAVRVRPLCKPEKNKGRKSCIVVQPPDTVILGKDRTFTFDHVFSPDQTQKEVYQQVVHPLVEGIFKGYHACLFAYGQTGAGKTYTMGTSWCRSGITEEHGMIPRVMQDLFAQADEDMEKYETNMKISFVEIYNEEIHDLLSLHQSTDTLRSPNHQKIGIREDEFGNVYLTGVHEETVRSFDEAMACIETGSLQRATASHDMNQQSSRSHAIFTVCFTRTVKEKNNVVERVTSQFQLVDLAGSERAKRTNASGTRLKEGISINVSLLALMEVISVLGDRQKQGAYIPYRRSKLTRILTNSLGGNSRTAMIACVSPSEDSFQETLNTLKYAHRARNIQNRPIVNIDPAFQEIVGLRNRVKELETLLAGKNATYPRGETAPQQWLAASDEQIVTRLDLRKPQVTQNKCTQTEKNEEFDSLQKKTLEEKQILHSKLKSLELERDVLLLQNENLNQVKKTKSLLNSQRRKRRTSNDSPDRIESSNQASISSENSYLTELDLNESVTTSERLDGGTEDQAEKNIANSFELYERRKYSLEAAIKEKEREFQSMKSSMEQEVRCLRMNVRLKEVLIRKLVQSEKKLSEKLKQLEDYAEKLREKIQKQEEELRFTEERLQHSDNQDIHTYIKEQYETQLATIRTETEQLEKQLRKLHRTKEMKVSSNQEREILEREINEMQNKQETLTEQMRAEEEKYTELRKVYEERLDSLQKHKEMTDKDLNRLKEECSRQKSIILRQQEVLRSCRIVPNSYADTVRFRKLQMEIDREVLRAVRQRRHFEDAVRHKAQREAVMAEREEAVALLASISSENCRPQDVSSDEPVINEEEENKEVSYIQESIDNLDAEIEYRTRQIVEEEQEYSNDSGRKLQNIFAKIEGLDSWSAEAKVLVVGIIKRWVDSRENEIVSLESLRTATATISELEEKNKQLLHQMKILQLEHDRHLTEQSIRYVSHGFVHDDASETETGVAILQSSVTSQEDTAFTGANDEVGLDVPCFHFEEPNSTQDEIRTPNDKNDMSSTDDALNFARLDISSCPNT